MELLRGETGRGRYGFVNANGWFATEHSCGVYSTHPTPTKTLAEWRELRQEEMREEREKGIPCVNVTRKLQDLIDNTVERVVVAARPSGRGRVETYTVVFDGDNQPSFGIVLGRLEGSNERFVAFAPTLNHPDHHQAPEGGCAPKDTQILSWMTQVDCVGVRGSLSTTEGGITFFYPDVEVDTKPTTNFKAHL